MTDSEHAAQLAAVRASLHLAEQPKDWRNVYPLRPRPVDPPRAA